MSRNRNRTQPFGGKGDHDGNGAVGGAHPPVDTATEPVREKTLHELNEEARAIDREHQRRRDEAERLAMEAAGPLLDGTMRGRPRIRRAQKPVRPPVTE